MGRSESLSILPTGRLQVTTINSNPLDAIIAFRGNRNPYYAFRGGFPGHHRCSGGTDTRSCKVLETHSIACSLNGCQPCATHTDVGITKPGDFALWLMETPPEGSDFIVQRRQTRSFVQKSCMPVSPCKRDLISPSSAPSTIHSGSSSSK